MRGWLALALVGCGSHHAGPGGDGGGSDGNGVGDAIVGDAAVDVMPDVPNVRGTVRVHIVDKAGAGKPGFHAVFIDTDQTVTDVVSDATGLAQADVFPGASVTAVCAGTGTLPCYGTAVTTVQAIEAGDDITLDLDAFEVRIVPVDTTTAGTFMVSYTAYSGAAGYSIYDPCGVTGASGTSKTLALQVGCVASTMDLVVVANNGTGSPLAYTEQANVAFTSGGSTTITDTWHALGPVTATYTNPTTAVHNIEVDRFVPGMRGTRATTSMDTSGTTVILQITSPRPTTAAMQTVLTPCLSTDLSCTASWTQTVTQLVDGTAASYALDVGAKLLPILGVPVFAPATSTLHVPAPIGGTTYDLAELDVRYVRASTFNYTWRVFGPSVGDFHFPTLPSTIPGDPTIRPTDVMAGAHAYVGASDAIPGYRAAIANPYDSLGTCESSSSATTKRFGGTLNRLSQSN